MLKMAAAPRKMLTLLSTVYMSSSSVANRIAGAKTSVVTGATHVKIDASAKCKCASCKCASCKCARVHAARMLRMHISFIVTIHGI